MQTVVVAIVVTLVVDGASGGSGDGAVCWCCGGGGGVVTSICKFSSSPSSSLNPSSTATTPGVDHQMVMIAITSILTTMTVAGAILQHPAMLVSTSTWWLNHTKYARVP
ncbi:hypothetical protein V8B97DRAFT_1920502 [Scleroderma yunnanense]